MIGGLLLYLLTLIIEVISLVCRFLLVAALCSLIAGPRVGLFVGVVASLGPLVYSLLVLCGLPSGHMLVRYALRARVANGSEYRAKRGVISNIDAKRLFLQLVDQSDVDAADPDLRGALPAATGSHDAGQGSWHDRRRPDAGPGVTRS